MIAARNEEANIRFTIEDILAQDYPRHLMEVIIVDDHSTDATAAIIRSYAGQGIRLLQMQETQVLNSYKKKAISEAIRISTGDLMVATDADCRMGPRWLSTVVSLFETEKPIMISSPVTYFQEKTFFERLQTLEFSTLIGVGGAFIGNGRASTCNGANLAYRKDMFYDVGGFQGIDELASGDDELLLQKIAEKYPGTIAFLKDRDALVYTHAKPNLAEFLQQRRRWASKSTKYKDKSVVAFAVGLWLFFATILFNFVGAFFSAILMKLFLLQFVLKLLLEGTLMLSVNTFLKRNSLMLLIPVLVPIHAFYIVYIGVLGNSKKYLWKGREVH